MKTIFQNFWIGFVILLFAYFGIKPMFQELVHFDEVKAYQSISKTGEISKIYFIPDNTNILLKQYQDQYEYGVYVIRGSSATHYLGPLYSTGESLFSFRIYRGSTAVWKVEMELVSKQGNLAVSTFEDIGYIFQDLMIIRDGSMVIGSRSYNEISITPRDTEFIRNAMEGPTYQEAIETFTFAIEDDPTDKFAYKGRGDSKFYLNDFNGAIADFTAAIRLDSNFGKAYLGRGLSKIALQQKDEGCSDLSKAGDLGVEEAITAIKKFCN